MRYATILFVLFTFAFANALPSDPAFERIIGGEVANRGQFPYQISLRHARAVWNPEAQANVTRYRHICGGSILNTRWIITAAHCTEGTARGMIIVTGALNINDTDGVRYPVARIVSHPGYDANQLKNDISLLRTRWAIQLGVNVQPIDISRRVVAEGKALVSGWGRTQDGDAAPILKFVHLSILNNTECRRRHNHTQATKIWDSTICTYEREGQGVCFGDSGGPLVLGQNLIGLVSWGVPCAIGRPDMFTRVSSFVDWVAWHTGVAIRDIF